MDVISQYQEDFNRLKLLQRVAGEYQSIELSKEDAEMVQLIIKRRNLKPFDTGSSLHVYSEQYEIQGRIYELAYEIGRNKNSEPMLVSELVSYNWPEQFEKLKAKYGITG